VIAAGTAELVVGRGVLGWGLSVSGEMPLNVAGVDEKYRAELNGAILEVREKLRIGLAVILGVFVVRMDSRNSSLEDNGLIRAPLVRSFEEIAGRSCG